MLHPGTETSQSGFTLIEVLIALVILAIALLAIIKALSSAAYTDGSLQEKLSAHWEAENVITEFQTHMKTLPPNQTDTVDGNDLMLGLPMYWVAGRVQGINQGNNRYYQRVYVNVYRNSGHTVRLQHMEGFVWVDKGVDQHVAS